MKLRTTHVLTLVLVLAACTSSAVALRNDIPFSINERFVQFFKFGFYKGGDSHVQMTYKPTEAQLLMLVCRESEYNTIMRSYLDATDMCNKAADIKCEVKTDVANGTLDRHDIMKHDDTYYFLLGNCDAVKLTGEIKVNFTNPNGQHLSTSLIPLPAMYSTLVYVWIGITAVWLANFLLHWRVTIPVHRLLSCVPLFKILEMLASAAYWNYVSVNGTISISILSLYLLSYAAFQGAFFLSLMVIAKGWGITRSSLSDFRVTVATVFFFVTAVVFHKLYQSFLLFAVILMHILVIRIIFTSIAINVRSIKMQLRTFADYGIDAHSTPVFAKFKLFHAFQATVATYVCLLVIVVIVDLFFLENTAWVQHLLSELVEWGVIVTVGWFLRLRNFPDYNADSDSDQDEEPALDAAHTSLYVVKGPTKRERHTYLATPQKRRKRRKGTHAHSNADGDDDDDDDKESNSVHIDMPVERQQQSPIGTNTQGGSGSEFDMLPLSAMSSIHANHPNHDHPPANNRDRGGSESSLSSSSSGITDPTTAMLR